jgi:hypothetical protein
MSSVARLIKFATRIASCTSASTAATHSTKYSSQARPFKTPLASCSRCYRCWTRRNSRVEISSTRNSESQSQSDVDAQRDGMCCMVLTEWRHCCLCSFSLQQAGSAKDVSELHKLIQPYMFRRMKGDVEKSLPPREETLISVQMTTVQKRSEQQHIRSLRPGVSASV